jgi:hypothetical protein
MSAKVPHKARPEKLRSACDSCYNSKVKCSRSRPLCSRCLVLGTNCVYSPSGRSGRKSRKSEENVVLEDSHPAQDGEEALQFDNGIAPFHSSFAYDTQTSAYTMAIPQSTFDTYPEHSHLEEFDPMLLMGTETASSPVTSAYGILSVDASSWMMDMSTSDSNVFNHPSDSSVYLGPASSEPLQLLPNHAYYFPRAEDLANIPWGRQSHADEHQSSQPTTWQYTSA